MPCQSENNLNSRNYLLIRNGFALGALGVNALNPEANTAYADIQQLCKMGEDVAAAEALAEQRPVTCHEHFFSLKKEWSPMERKRTLSKYEP